MSPVREELNGWDGSVRPTPSDAAARVEELPRRSAHALHALIVAEKELGMPPTAAEVVVYDAESLGARGTAQALRRASERGLCATVNGLWVASQTGHDLKSSLEERFLRETSES